MTRVQSNLDVQNPGSAILMKGTGYGIRTILPEAPTEEELLDLLLRVPSQAYLLPVGDGVVLDFQSRVCSEKLLLDILRYVVWPRGIRVLAWVASDKMTQALIARAGLRSDEPSPALSSEPLDCPNRLVLYNALRSGQKIEHGGDVILWGHLNAGAEILAAGSVLVAGRLKGIVHAGKEGREDVYVLAGSFETPQVRVGHRLCYVDESMNWWRKTVLITLEEEKLIIREGCFLEGSNGLGSPKNREGSPADETFAGS